MAEKKKEEKVVITPDLRKTWIRVRSAWNLSFEAFNNVVSMLDKKQSEALYDLVKHALFMANCADILRQHPELREVLKNEEDRLCMHDIYEILSWKLGRSEPLPKEIRAREAMRGTIGRASPNMKP